MRPQHTAAGGGTVSRIQGLAPLLAALLVLAPRAASGYELRLNCGGGDYTSQSGAFFEADRRHMPGGAGFMPDTAWAGETWHVIGGTVDPSLYSRTRNSPNQVPLEYRFDNVPNGGYLVTLHLVDIFKHSSGENVFDVLIEGAPALSNVDVYALVERTYAIDFTVAATVADSVLNVVLAPDPGLGFASLAAISVVSREPDQIAPGAPTGFTVSDNYGWVALDWDDSTEDDIAGYRIERRAGPGDQFTVVNAQLQRVSRWMDPAAPGESWQYRVRAVDAYGNASDATGVERGNSFDDSTSDLPTVEIVIAPDSLEYLNDFGHDPAFRDYVECDILFDGEPHPDAICRYRGNITRALRKKSWKIQLLGTYWVGRDNFNLNAEYIDKSILREALSYTLMDRNGVLTPRARFVHLMVNGDWMGVRADIENVSTEFLERVGLPTINATVYKLGDKLQVLPTLADYKAAYEKEIGDPSDYSDLIEFIEALNFTAPDSLFHYLAGHLDLNRFLDFYSSQVVIQNMDITFKNWFLHHDLTTDRWTPIPWDQDLTLGNTFPFTGPFSTTESVFLGNFNLLLGKVRDVPALAQLHFDRVRQIFDTTFTVPITDALIDSVYNVVTGDAERDWWKWGWERSELFHSGPAELRDFVTGRTSHLLGQIAFYENPSDLVLNEIMASNSVTVTDEWGDYDDWVELLNRGDSPVSTLGLYLTDDLTLPGRFALPDTTLLPGEWVIIWCDAEPTEGAWHAPFKLDADGEEVGIFSGPLATSAPVDVKVFDPQWTDVSLGRLPDGGPLWQLMPTATPGAPNVGGGNIRPQVHDVEHFPGAPPANAPVRITARLWDDGALVATEVYYDAGAGFVAVPLLDDGMNGDGEAGDGLYGAFLPGQPAATVVLYYVRAEDDLGAVTVAPPDAPVTTYTYTTGYEAPALVLNEFMASNDTTIADEHQDYDDWVELWNAGQDTLALGGMHLTDNFLNPDKWVIPEVSLPPGEFLIIWCDGEPWEGALHTTFKLDADGEELGLFDTVANGVGLIDTVSFGPQVTDVSYGRLPDGGAWRVLFRATPGATNGTDIGVEGAGGAVPRVLALCGPYPNPFNPSAAFELDLPAGGVVRLSVYDVGGRRVRALEDGLAPAGRHRITWDGRDDRGRPVASGVYWLRLEAGGERRVLRGVLVR